MMTEEQTRTLHRRGVEQYQRGDAHRWAFCFIARRMGVGNHAEGAAMALAHDINRSVDVVELMADAARVYWFLRPRFRYVSDLRRQLSWSHFAALGRLWNKYEFDPHEAIGLLEDAAEYRQSVAQMRRVIEDKHGAPKPEPNRWDGETLGIDYKPERNRKVIMVEVPNDTPDPVVGGRLRLVEVVEQ